MEPGYAGITVAMEALQAGSRSRPEIVTILRLAVRRAREDNLTNIAAALAYYAFLSIPSLLMVAVGVFGLVGQPGDARSLVERLGTVLPSQAQTLLDDSLTTLTQNKGTGVTVLLIGVVIALWSLTGAMQTVMWGLNVAYATEETRGFIRRRLTSLAMVGFAALGVVLVFGLLVLGPHLTRWIGDALGRQTLVSWCWWVAEWPVLLAGLAVASGGIYALGPNVKHRGLRFVSVGSVLGIVVWLGVSGAFAFYVSRFGSYNKSWGSLSAVVVMLTWLWLSSLALLVGAEVDAEAERYASRTTVSGTSGPDAGRSASSATRAAIVSSSRPRSRRNSSSRAAAEASSDR